MRHSFEGNIARSSRSSPSALALSVNTSLSECERLRSNQKFFRVLLSVQLRVERPDEALIFRRRGKHMSGQRTQFTDLRVW